MSPEGLNGQFTGGLKQTLANVWLVLKIKNLVEHLSLKLLY